MQRETKYRGFSKHNKVWVYGYFMADNTGGGYIVEDLGCDITACQDCGMPSMDYYEVLPETVGQYTGLKDKNGKEVYEGDVVKPQYKDTIGAVTWRNDRFIIKWIKGIDYLRNDLDYWSMISHIEIIGNIHDNPELLTQSPTSTA